MSSEQQAFTLLEQGLTEKAKLEVWTKDRKHKIEAKLTEISSDHKTFVVSVKDSNKLSTFVKSLETLQDSSCLISVDLHQMQLYCVTVASGFNEKSLQFHVPSSAYEVQRRYNIRYCFARESGLTVTIQHPLDGEKALVKTLLDVSSGGLAFIADVDESGIFGAGQSLPEVTFRIDGHEVVAQAHVCHCTKIAPANDVPYLKVGISFKRIKPRDANFLNRFVHEQTMNFFANQRG